VISEPFATTRTTIGFTSKSTLDESPDAREKTRLAVARAKEGDRDALRFLYVTYSNNVYGYVRSILHNGHDAEDVTQQVFAKLITSLVKYEDRGPPFSAWLLRLARNVAIDHLRRTRRTPTGEVFDLNAGSGPDLAQAEIVRTALASLPDDQREVVILRHLVGLTPGEIAERMCRTEGSVHGLHQRGRRALRRKLERLDSTPCIREPRLAAA
jgi:RNA polymerase sigma-70 factor (ECF subfamily)